MKVLLDTVVISELTKDSPQLSVIRFLATIGDDDAFLSVMTIGEIADGIDRMPVGARRNRYAQWFREIQQSFTTRILPVDEHIAEEWGRLSASIHRMGGRLEVVDGLMAATALVHHLTVATRNVRDFERTGVPIVDPWLDEDDR